MDTGGAMTLSIAEKIETCIALQQEIGQDAQDRADKARAQGDLNAIGVFNRKEERARMIVLMMKEQELPYIRDFRGPTLPPTPAA